MHGTNRSSQRDRPRSDELKSNNILVWDLPTRLFHWLLVGAVATAAITGFLAPERWLDVHYWSGSFIGFLVVFRLVWGFVGSWYARFKSFLFPLPETLAHLRALSQRRTSHYTGHNPAGALMVFALLGTLTVLTITGLLILGGQENIGLLAGFVPYALGAAVVEFHELLAFALLALIAAHIIGVLTESLLSKENLVRAMITGRKSSAAMVAGIPAAFKMSRWRAVGVALTIVVLIAGSAEALMQVKPSGYVQMPANTAYASECGDCHHAYHPSLLPAASWQKMMATLSDHFGEDASLDKQTTGSLTNYLQTYASEAWDSEAANNLRRVSTSDPLRITSSPYWKRRHKDISSTVFKQKNVASKGNCIACHADASTGRFNDQNIKIPRPPSTSNSNVAMRTAQKESK